MGNNSVFPKSERLRFDQLDGLRGICALAVLVGHLIKGSYWAIGSNLNFYPSFFLSVIGSFSHAAVLIFFVLSGFVIGYTTPELCTTKEIKKYLLRRLIRIYPIYLFSLFLTFSVAKTPPTLVDVFGHLFFLQGWIVPVFQDNLPLWSLQYEFMFYLMFIVIWRLKSLLTPAIFTCTAFAILSSLSDFYILKLLGYFTIWLTGLWLAKNMYRLKILDNSYKSNRFWSSFILIAAFGTQNIFYMLVNKYGVPSERPPSDIILLGLIGSVVSATINCNFPGYLLSFVTAYLSTLLVIVYSFYNNTFYSESGIQAGYPLAGFFLLVLPFTFLINRVPLKILIKISSLGAISYALYVIHFPILCLVYRTLPIGNVLSETEFWIISSLISVLSLSVAWILECYLHPKISEKLKIKFGLSTNASNS